ncbi:MAG TPA: hypothetical protein ENI05_13510 [Porticoccus sp.]|nr:hypothetical protein [Porticoccus sp.]
MSENDYVETLKLMGLGGKNALDKAQVAFVMDLYTYWKSKQLAVVKTGDVFSAPQIEGGELVKLWGYAVYGSAHMHRANQDAIYGLKANSAGKVDLDTPANNTTGSLVAFRRDQWMLGYKRQMTFETTRYANADATEIVALMRVGLINHDNEASAITYGLVV